MRVAAGAEGSVHGAGMDGVRRDAATLEPAAQLPHEHDDGELWDGENEPQLLRGYLTGSSVTSNDEST